MQPPEWPCPAGCISCTTRRSPGTRATHNPLIPTLRHRLLFSFTTLVLRGMTNAIICPRSKINCCEKFDTKQQTSLNKVYMCYTCSSATSPTCLASVCIFISRSSVKDRTRPDLIILTKINSHYY